MNPPTREPLHSTPATQTAKAEADAAERYGGRVRSVEVTRERGLIQTRDGRILPFNPALVRVAGMITQASELRPGMPVTFDLSHGQNGPMVSRLWVGEGPWQSPTLPE